MTFPFGRENAIEIEANTWAFRKNSQEIDFFRTLSPAEQFKLVYSKTAINAGRNPPSDEQVARQLAQWQTSARSVPEYPLSDEEFKVVLDLEHA